MNHRLRKMLFQFSWPIDNPDATPEPPRPSFLEELEAEFRMTTPEEFDHDRFDPDIADWNEVYQ